MGLYTVTTSNRIRAQKMQNYSAAGKPGLHSNSRREVTQHFLDRIQQHDKQISFITVTPEIALQQAKHADQMRSQALPAITGVPSARHFAPMISKPPAPLKC